MYAYEGRKSIYDGSYECYEYPEDIDYDSSWETAKTFGVLSGIAAGFIAISIWGWACCRIMSDQTIGKLFVYLSTFACFASGMMFTFVNNDLCDDDSKDYLSITKDATKTGSECSFASGGKCAISGTVFWFVSIILSIRAKKKLDVITPVDEIAVVTMQRVPLVERQTSLQPNQEVEEGVAIVQ